MLSKLIDFAIRRRVTIVMFTIAIALFGVVSLTRLKLNLLPDLSYPTLTIRTELPGAAPLEVENLVTRPVEEAVSIIRNVREVRSVSRAGQSDVTLEFLWGTDMDISGIDVREKLDLLRTAARSQATAAAALRPVERAGAAARVARRKRQGRRRSVERLKALRRLAEDRLKPDLEAVEGSAAVKVSGGYEDEVQVFVDQQKLAQLGLSIDVVTRRMRAENVNLSGGRLEQGTQRFLVRTLNEFETVEQMANAIIATQDGQPIYLRDVANVTRGYKDREAITRVNGKEAIELAVYKEGDANTVQLADRRARARQDHAEEPARRHGHPHGLRPVDVHRRGDQRGEERGGDRRPARDPRAVRVPARRARHADQRHRHPGVGARHVRADVRVRPHAQHHVARRHRARGRHARRQRGRGARKHRAQPGERPRPARGRPAAARPRWPRPYSRRR